MSRQLINEYRSDLDRIIKVGGNLNEGSVRDAFQSLLKSWGRSNDLTYLSEHPMTTAQGTNIRIDGALVYDIRVPFGYWEAKDSKDDLEEEIRNKEAKGYPKTNIIYEDTNRAVLIQDGKRTAEADMKDTEELYALLTQFFGYEQASIRDFRKAIAKFSEDLPAILEALRDRIREKREDSPNFARAEEVFLKQVKQTINPTLERADVTEMLIQHILTEDIFNRVFDMRDYHRDNNIAKQLYELERELFGYGEKRKLLQALRPYYTGIEETAHLIQSHSEKQNFLKSLYENFYKVYNPKAADRLGVVYTPGEIVRFMIRSADWLCEKHFGKNLVDQGVEILDPATGTGTYVVELLEYFRGQPEKLTQKYKEELHANEVAILPYYVANLNIEATYQAITGKFAEFEGLCLVDTLDNVDGLGIHSGYQFDMLGALSDENIERVKRQNRRKISVIIGNPPYNANQQNENDDNKNRKYPHVDKRIKETFIKRSNAKKPKAYDMYSKFFRWSFDRLSDEGIVAFITNRSFIWAKTYDGFRQIALENFADIWVLDLGGDWKQKGAGGGENVFGISTGVAICFLVKRKGKGSGSIHYAALDPELLAEDKLAMMGNHGLHELVKSSVRPDNLGYWIDPGHPDFGNYLPLISEKTKLAKTPRGVNAIFRAYTNGINTARDSWVYGRKKKEIAKKVKLFGEVYSAQKSGEEFNKKIKWSRNLKKKWGSGRTETFAAKSFRTVSYRPFTLRKLYASDLLIDEAGDNFSHMPQRLSNRAITFPDTASRAPWHPLSAKRPIDFHYGPTSDGHKSVPRYTFVDDERIDNITDWALNKFVKRYGKRYSKPDGRKLAVTKDVIFAYCYAVLHDPIYREKYALNLKREFPRIPFYPDFAQWVDWGETLLDLHIDYEEVEAYPLERVDTPNHKRAKGSAPKPKLRSIHSEDAETGSVVVDEDTQITGIPAGAWNYRLGNRSAIDWVLDQHKQKKPRDKTIREKFNTYRFADYKESMIELLAKVVRVSVETNAITDAMKELDRSDWEN